MPTWTVLGIVFSTIAFWSLRLGYWLQNPEQPFSDMADYVKIAMGIKDNWHFAQDTFFQSHHVPGLPLLIALVFFIFGDYNQIAWQLFQSAIVFVAAAWIAFNLRRMTQSSLLAFGFFLIVAFSQSSIFWSLKYATEGSAEAFLYCTIWALLSSTRSKDQIVSLVFTGAATVFMCLIRPNFFPFVAAIGLFVILPKVQIWGGERKKIVAAFILGAALVWGPWLARGLVLYKGIVPFSTHGAASFFWELGEVNVKLESGNTLTFTSQELEAYGYKNYPNDYEYYKFSKGLIGLWIKQNPEMYAQLIKRRIPSLVDDNSAGGLTRVPRETLFKNQLDTFLIEKSKPAIVLGFIGLFILALHFHTFWAISLGLLGTVFMTASIIGYGRMLDPTVPLILFGNLAYPWLLVKRFPFKKTPKVS